MTVGTYDTVALTLYVRAIEDPPFFLTNGVAAGFDGFFPETDEQETKKIYFDKETVSRRVTPFVAPVRSGRVVERRGFETDSFEPAYVKDKRVFEPDEFVEVRRAGERIGGEMSPASRRDQALTREMDDQREMFARREEQMAAELLRTGAVTVQGDGFPTRNVDFQRDASLTVTESGTDLWSDSAANPVDLLEDYAQLMADANGGAATDVVMAQNVWQVARTKQAVKDALNREFAQQSNIELGPMAGKVRLIGQLGDFRIWVYTATYIDESGSTQKFVPDNYLYMVNAEDLMGVRTYGIIRDEDAGLESLRFFEKSWTEEDPSVRYLLFQSAPLLVPYRVDCTLSAQVL